MLAYPDNEGPGSAAKLRFQDYHHVTHCSLARPSVEENACCVWLFCTLDSCASTAPGPMLQCVSSDHFSVLLCAGDAQLLRASQKALHCSGAISLGHAFEHESCCPFLPKLAFLCAGDALLIRAVIMWSTAGLGLGSLACPCAADGAGL